MQNSDPHETAGPNDRTLAEARRAMHGERIGGTFDLRNS